MSRRAGVENVAAMSITIGPDAIDRRATHTASEIHLGFHCAVTPHPHSLKDVPFTIQDDDRQNPHLWKFLLKRGLPFARVLRCATSQKRTNGLELAGGPQSNSKLNGIPL